MESAALLSPVDINLIRRYVYTKYARLSGNRRAEIIADAIRRALQQRLPDLPAELKDRLTDELISRCLVSEQRDVQLDDVLDLCAEFDQDEAARGEQLMRPLLAWMNERAPGRWNGEQVAARLASRKNGSLVPLPCLAEQEETKPQRVKGRSLRQLFAFPYAWLLLAAVAACALGAALLLNQSAVEPKAGFLAAPSVHEAAPMPKPDVGMPEQLRYREVDVKALKTYLKSRDALLAEEPYFEAIVNSARTFDIHPLLLFAITGQEQGFVPKSSKNALKIANNPFNVFHSWEQYNTDIHHSADIAARLIAKLAESRPEGHEPFAWFNKTYAEDPLWSEGVRKIFEKLVRLPPSS